MEATIHIFRALNWHVVLFSDLKSFFPAFDYIDPGSGSRHRALLVGLYVRTTNIMCQAESKISGLHQTC